MGAGLFLQGETRKRFLPEQPYQRQKSDMKETNGGINYEQNRGNDRES